MPSGLSTKKLHKRKPVLRDSVNVPEKLSSKSTKTMAVDPGLAVTGLAVILWGEGPPKVETAELLKTKKATKKELQTTRVATDDQRRMREIWERVRLMLRTQEPIAVAIEAYSPIPGKQGGGAWKVGAVTQMIMGLCWSEGIAPVVVRPSDLRRRFLRRDTGSKMDIEQAVGGEVSGASALLEQFARSHREHVADALGYAVIAHEEMMRIRSMAGL